MSSKLPCFICRDTSLVIYFGAMRYFACLVILLQWGDEILCLSVVLLLLGVETVCFIPSLQSSSLDCTYEYTSCLVHSFMLTWLILLNKLIIDVAFVYFLVCFSISRVCLTVRPPLSDSDYDDSMLRLDPMSDAWMNALCEVSEKTSRTLYGLACSILNP